MEKSIMIKRCFSEIILFVFLSLSACTIIDYRAVDNVDDYILPCPKSGQEVAKECLLVLKEDIRPEVYFCNNQTLEGMYIGVINRASGENLKHVEKKYASNEELFIATVDSIEREEISKGMEKFDFANDVSVSAPYESGVYEFSLMKDIAEHTAINRYSLADAGYFLGRYGVDYAKKKKVFEENLSLKITNGEFKESAISKDKLVVIDYKRNPRVEANSVTTTVELDVRLETVEGVLIKRYFASAEETERFGFPSVYSSSNEATYISGVKAFQKALFRVFDQVAKDDVDKLQKVAEEKHNEEIKAIKESAILQFKKKKDLLFKKYGEKQAYLILGKRIGIGMSEEALLESWGKPGRKNEHVGAWGKHKQYVYSSAYVNVENGKVVSWQIGKL